MILFFDRDVGTSLPKALLTLRFDKQFHELHYHQQHFPMDCLDDIWLSQVGSWGWTVIGHDSRHHTFPAELSAIKQHKLGCFYLWGGAEAKRWQKMQCFARAYDKIVEAEETTVKPFIYTINRVGRLKQVPIP